MEASFPRKFDKLKAYYSQLLPTLNAEGEAWKFCESLLRVRNIKKGDMILQEGCVCNYVSFINYGLIKMYYMVDGREKIMCFANDNSYISDCHSFYTRQPSMCNMQAIEDTELVETSYDDLQMIYETIPQTNVIGRRIAEQLLISENEGRVDSLKYNIDQSYAKLMDEKPWLIQKVPQYMIASYLGVTPEALSRVKARISKSKKVVPEVY